MLRSPLFLSLCLSALLCAQASHVASLSLREETLAPSALRLRGGIALNPTKWFGGGDAEKKAAPKIIIAGAPASGKGTQCEFIVNSFGVSAASCPCARNPSCPVLTRSVVLPGRAHLDRRCAERAGPVSILLRTRYTVFSTDMR
eukprot:1287796-Rhodomonas_salina.2